MCVHLHNTFFSGNFNSLQTLWYMLITHLYWCHYETVNSVQNRSAADAFRTRPAFSLRALMEVWKTILCLVHATEGKHLQSQQYKFGALPRYKRVQLQGQIHFWILGGPIHVGSLCSWIEIVRIDFARGSYELTWPTQPNQHQVGWAPPKTG